jgi:hypothetical protein
MEKARLNAENFNNIMEMLSSPDKENIVMGLSYIEESDITNSLTYLLLIKKLANITDAMWKAHAPKTADYLKNLDIPTKLPVTYQKILTVLEEKKVPISDIEFFINKYMLYIVEVLKCNYIIDSIEVKLKHKLNK